MCSRSIALTQDRLGAGEWARRAFGDDSLTLLQMLDAQLARHSGPNGSKGPIRLAPYRLRPAKPVKSGRSNRVWDPVVDHTNSN